MAVGAVVCLLAAYCAAALSALADQLPLQSLQSAPDSESTHGSSAIPSLRPFTFSRIGEHTWLVTLKEHEGHSSVSELFKCTCAALSKISTGTPATRAPSASC